MYFTNELSPPPVELIHFIHWSQFGTGDRDMDDWSQFWTGDRDMDVGLEEVTNKVKNEEVTNKDKNDEIGGAGLKAFGAGLEACFRGLEVLFQCCALFQ